MARVTKQDKKIQKQIAKKRINKLFNMADQKALEGNFDYADRYVEIARKIAMRNLVSIPKEYKRKFCKHCYSYLLPGSNCRIRIHRGKLIIYCNNCNKFTRILLKNSNK